MTNPQFMLEYIVWAITALFIIGSALLGVLIVAAFLVVPFIIYRHWRDAE